MSAMPVSTRSVNPTRGWSLITIFENSSRIRSAETIDIRSACADIASTTSVSTIASNCDAKRAARIIRKGSSSNEDCAVPGVRMRFTARSAIPSNKSTNSMDGNVTAIAFIVKSRRARSSARLSPNATSGLRDRAS